MLESRNRTEKGYHVAQVFWDPAPHQSFEECNGGPYGRYWVWYDCDFADAKKHIETCYPRAHLEISKSSGGFEEVHCYRAFKGSQEIVGSVVTLPPDGRSGAWWCLREKLDARWDDELGLQDLDR